MRVELSLTGLTGDKKIGQIEVPLAQILKQKNVQQVYELDLTPKGKVSFSVACHGMLDSSSSTAPGVDGRDNRAKYLVKVFDLAGSQMPETEAIGLK